MSQLEQAILALVSKPDYRPLKPKALARKLHVAADQYSHFRRTLRQLIDQKRLEIAKSHAVRPSRPHGTVTGIYRRTSSGTGFVRPHLVDGRHGPEILIREEDARDAATGDEVVVRITRKPTRLGLGPRGQILSVLTRATRQFVGTYFEREGDGFVRVDGTVFSHSIYVGDPGAKGARPDDKVVFEMLRFPSPEDRGEGVVTEILGRRGQPGVDALAVIRGFDLPDRFPDDALEEARHAAALFSEEAHDGREDFTDNLVLTIDPDDARDFDDAITLSRDPRTKHWHLGVHIADVSHFAPAGGALDREARKRGTSVYLPQRVLPMFPEMISNGLASLQQGKLRYVKSALLDFTSAGQRTAARFAEGIVRVRKRFTYDQVSEILAHPEAFGHRLDGTLVAMLLQMRDFAMVLRQRRHSRGALELDMPETQLEYDDRGRVTGAHFRKHDVSHQIVEEFMLAANEAVAHHFAELGTPFLRRVHSPPDPAKLEAFATFARGLGYKLRKETDRFALQRVLEQSAAKPEMYSVHYALLRSLKQAVYSPQEEGHFALASDTYCHFTSPIRRYPDLVVHRQLGQWLHRRKVGADLAELTALGEHCSKMERRAEAAERELIKIKLLTFLEGRLGMELDAIITGVADYGFFAQGEHLPAEGLVHVSTLLDDYYHYDDAAHSLTGRRTHRRFRLGDRVRVEVVRVDTQRRQLDFRVVDATTRKPVGDVRPAH